MKRRRILIPATAGLLTGGLAWVMGVVTVDAILIGVLVAVLVGTPRWLGYPADWDWPAAHMGDGGQRGYYEVRRLAALFRRESSGDPFNRLIAPRLRELTERRLPELAERRLAAAGQSLDDAAAREILGADVVDWLHGRPSRLDKHPRVKQAELMLDRLDEYEENRQL